MHIPVQNISCNGCPCDAFRSGDRRYCRSSAPGNSRTESLQDCAVDPCPEVSLWISVRNHWPQRVSSCHHIKIHFPSGTLLRHSQFQRCGILCTGCACHRLNDRVYIGKIAVSIQGFIPEAVLGCNVFGKLGIRFGYS